MPASTPATGADRPRIRIFATVILTFIGYLTVALPLAILPSFVASDLGFGAAIAGLTIGTQYFATTVTRAQVGRMADLYGPKRAVVWGFAACVLSGVLTLAASLVQEVPSLSLTLLLAGRLALGLAESWVSTGAITWAIGQVGPGETARIISWNGIAIYGALALGAPLGVALTRSFGFTSMGVSACALGLTGLACALAKAPVAIIAEKRIGLRDVIARILPYGCALGLAATGFGVIATFVTLYFRSRQWQGASVSLTLFGLSFIVARLLMSAAILRFGGLRVTLLSFGIEFVGLVLLWQAASPAMAIAAAGVVGFGFAPIFPALGVVAVSRVPPQNRGAAIGLYSVFMDVALGITGPVAGLLIERFGAVAPFWFGAAACLIGMAVTAALLAR